MKRLLGVGLIVFVGLVVSLSGCGDDGELVFNPSDGDRDTLPDGDGDGDLDESEPSDYRQLPAHVPMAEGEDDSGDKIASLMIDPETLEWWLVSGPVDGAAVTFICFGPNSGDPLAGDYDGGWRSHENWRLSVMTPLGPVGGDAWSLPGVVDKKTFIGAMVDNDLETYVNLKFYYNSTDPYSIPALELTVDLDCRSYYLNVKELEMMVME